MSNGHRPRAVKRRSNPLPPAHALPPLDVNRRYGIPLASLYMDQSRAQTYNQIRAGRLPSIKDGARRYISGHTIAQRSRLDSESS